MNPPASPVAVAQDIAKALEGARAMHHAGRSSEAERVCRRILALRPGHFVALNLLGMICAATHRLDEAVRCFRAAGRINPKAALVHNNEGSALAMLGQHEAALDCFERAATLEPAYAEAFNNRGNSLAALNRHGEAIAAYDRAITLKPDYAEAFNNRGVALRELDRPDAALDDYARALRARPDYTDAQMNEGLARLALGDLEAGLPKFEYRWQATLRAARRSFPQPLWLGDAEVAGRTILLHAEQGFGDTLQFCRYAPLVAALGAKVLLEVPRELVRLLSRMPHVRTVAAGEPLPDFDLHCPLMSLPLAFGTTLATIPAEVPYLDAEPGLIASWRQRLAVLPGKRVGLTWAGGARPHQFHAQALDRRRSIGLAGFAGLATLPGLVLVSLQKGPPAAEARAPPSGMVMHDWTDALEDFADTAALIMALDLVICVDTAVAHLAGALGKPVWVLNRFDQCWRWLRGRHDSPWYPSARLFRQPVPGDWDSVMREVVTGLRDLCTAGPTASTSS
jgi:Flp pilus assembly protein TadD